MFLRFVKPIHCDVEFPEGVVTQCGSDRIFSNMLQLEVEGFEVLLLGGLVLPALLESKAFVVVLDSFSHYHRVCGGRVDVSDDVGGPVLFVHLWSFLC